MITANSKVSAFFVLFFLSSGFVAFILTSNAEAIPPPDIIRIGSVLVQVLGFFLVFFSTAFFFVKKKALSFFSSQQSRWLKLLFLTVPVFIVVTALAVSAVYVRKKNRDILAGTSAVKEQAILADGAITVAGMQFDIADPSFKIEPRNAEKLLGNEKYFFIDIREPVEFSIRYIPGFINIRLGDLVAGQEYRKLDAKKTIVLICEVGERGSAIAVFLRLKGYEAFYIENGIRGWREKKLKFVGNDKMYLPEFKNKYEIVTSENAKSLLSEGKAVLVDVRATAEFDRGHIAGALNIPLVNMPSKELEKALDQLPKNRRVIGIAYDRFGAYYCKIIGYLVNQKNLEYGGTLKIQPQNQTL